MIERSSPRNRARVGLESLPRAAVLVERLAAALIERPAEAVRVSFAAGESSRRQNLFPALTAQDPSFTYGCVPREEIAHRQVERAIGRRIQLGATHS